MRGLTALAGILGVVGGLAAAVQAQDQFTVSRCPSVQLPMSFSIDCSHVADPAQKKLCRPFIENVACKAFPAYREITGLRLETRCPSIKYTIYDKDKFPHHEGEGGVAMHCAVDYVAQYSIVTTSKLGPYDVHEILHEYQTMLGALPDAHILFGSSMLEALRLMGAEDLYEERLKPMKEEAARLKATANNCTAAETAIEESLYLENPKVVYLYYRKLVIGWQKDMADRQARFNRMFYAASGNQASVKQYLITHGCAPF